MGLVNQVVEAAELENCVRDYAPRITVNAPLSHQAADTPNNQRLQDTTMR